MRDEIRKRIETVRRGEVPEGYQQVDGYVIPGDWHLEAFSKKFKRSLRRNASACNNVLTISAQLGLVSQKEYYDKDIASEDKSGYFHLRRGEFAYNKSYSSGYPYGAIKRLEKYEEGIVSPLYICFEPMQETNAEFYSHYFEAGLYNREIYRFAQEGARNHGLLNISTEDFCEGALIVPPEEEQQKIADILAACDRVIELKQKRVEELKQLKKTCLATMFPQDGENVPELRFPGFTAPWEQRKLGDVGTTYTGLSGKTKEDFGHGEARFITYMNVYSNAIVNPTMVEPIEIDNKQKQVEVGDVFFTTSSETPDEVGMSSVLLEKQGPTYLNSFCFGYRPTEKFDPYYLAYMLRSEAVRKDIILLAQGISRYNISKNKMMEIEIPVPSLPEQNKIGVYFKSLDDLITLHQRELEAEQQKKKALMQLLLTGLVRV